jgi:sirohydrochlorin ferrochelatase
MKGIVVVDHGSQRAEANEMMQCVANLVQAMAAEDVVVRFAHMELAPPTVAEAFAQCVDAGADEVVVFPYMLSPGRHSTADIPRMVAAAAANHPGVEYSVTHAFGVHEKLAEVVLLRAGVAAREMSAAEAARCWDPNCSEKLCGDACRALQARENGSENANDRAVR